VLPAATDVEIVITAVRTTLSISQGRGRLPSSQAPDVPAGCVDICWVMRPRRRVSTSRPRVPAA
jgi:hypothetical protein